MADKLTDEQIEAACLSALAHGLGAPDSDVSQARERNLQYYNAEAVGELAPPEVDDRSDFVATDVSDTIDGMLPQIMRMFVGSDDAVVFEGQGQPGSEEQAKLATAYVNHLFYVRNDGVGVIHDWFKDALLQKVGFVKVWAEEETDDAKQKYEGQSPEQLAMLQMEGWDLSEEPQADENGLLTFTVTKESRRKSIKVQACVPSEMRVDVNARWGDEPAMIGQVFARRKFELAQDGYDVSELAAYSGGHFDQSMLEELGETDDFGYTAPHDSHELAEFAEVFIKLDRDGDGVAEWLKVCLLNGRIALYDDGSVAIEQVDDHPYCWICPIPRAHAFFGDCPADRAIEPQKLRTRLIRSIDDNLAFSVNSRLYVNTSAEVNIDDVLDSRPGGVIRGRGPASDAVTPIAQPLLANPAYQFNEYIASWAENRTGFNRYSAGTDQNALNKTARGTELLTAKADMRMELIARFFAVGVRQMFAKMLKLSIQHQNATEMVAISGQFVPINPSEFRNQFNVRINVGLGAGSKEQQSARIMGLLQLLQMGSQAGVVRPQHLAEAIKLYVEANEFKNPERFVDPEPTGMPTNPQQFQQIQQQMQEMGRRGQELEQENARLKIEKEEVQLDAKRKELSAEAEKMNAQFDAREQQFDALVQGARSEVEQVSGEAQRLAELEQQVAGLTAVVTGLLSQQIAPDANQGMEAPAASYGGMA